MKIELGPGEKVEVIFEGTDGVITVDFNSDGDDSLSVHADMPDTNGREGIVYCELFGKNLPGHYREEEDPHLTAPDPRTAVFCPHCGSNRDIRKLDDNKWPAYSLEDLDNKVALTEYQCLSDTCCGESFWLPETREVPVQKEEA